jgi:DNA-binding response OmpR family regulator
MTGLDFVKLVRNSPKSPNPFVSIIMLTGHTHIDHVRLARDAGANEFLAKPVSVKAILSRMLSVIEHPRPFVRTDTYFGPCRRRRMADDYQGPERRLKREVTALDDLPGR